MMSPATKLLRWYDTHGRNLPWRKTRDPYKILVSEIMLQQTQVSRVLLFYKKWLTTFPNWQTLARASNADVIHAWAGLGYNRRALALRDIARHVVEDGTPKTEEAWKQLKGIGDYTAAALSAFSQKQRTFPIDSVIRRVGGRLLLGIPYPKPTVDARLHKAAKKFLPQNGRFYDVPQALFDLATAVCVKVPSCAICPMRNDCLAAPKFLSGRMRIPKAMIVKAKETKHRGKPYPDRIYRGRILRLVRESSNGIDINTIGLLMDPQFQQEQDKSWFERMIDRLEKDRLIQRNRGKLKLPKH